MLIRNARVNNPLRSDPTRTVTLRKSFEADFVRRFAKFRQKLVSLIVDEDTFGLKQQNQSFIPTVNFSFSSTQLNVTDLECLRRIRELQGRLDLTDVIELETAPHVTVRYGLHGQDPEVVREIVANVFCKTGEGGGVDPSCRLTKKIGITERTGLLWQERYSDYSKISKISVAVIAGRDPELVMKEVGGDKKHLSAAKAIVKAIDHAEIDDVPLFRTENLRPHSLTEQDRETLEKRRDFLESLKPGDSFPLERVTSFTTSKSNAVSYKPVSPMEGDSYSIVTVGSHRSLPLSESVGDWNTERLTYGEFKVIKISEEGGYRRVITIRQTELVTNSFGPIWITLGRLSLFQQPEHDVLKLDVQSWGLERLNTELGKLPNVQTHDNYEPHLTIAYLKPGTGWKYLADPSFLEWRSYVFTELTFSDKERRQTELALNVFCKTGEGGGVDPSCGNDEKIEKQIQEYRKQGIPENRLTKIRETLHEKKRVEKLGADAAADTPERREVNRQVFTDLKEKYGDPDKSDRSEAAYFVTPDKYQIRMASHVQIHSRSSSHVVVVQHGASDDSWYHLDSVIVTTYKKTPEQVMDEIEQGLNWWRGGQVGDKPKFNKTPGITVNTRWSFRSSPEKITEFLKWLQQNLQPILTDPLTTDDDWWNKYIQAGFKKGAARSYDDMKKAGAIPQSNLPFYLGQKDEFLKSAFRQPESINKVKMLAGRVYTELNGVTEAMSQNLSRALTDGLVQGMNPRQIATNIIKVVEDIGIRRARVIARTEIIRAHAEGQLDAMERLGVKKLAVMVEWNTAGDARVCKLCQPLEGVVVTIDEAKGLIPRHPQCRCAFIPANVGEDPAEQVRGAVRIKKAITRSLVAGKPKKGKSKSSWAGARRKISKFRPKSKV